MTITNQEERGISGWLELYDLSLHTDIEARIPREPYIRGVVGPGPDRKFKPGKFIVGKPMEKPSEINGTPGWVELRTVQFHRDMEAVQPIPPYVHGLMDAENHFYPDEPFVVIAR